MNSYSIFVFLHILGAVTMFASWGIEGVIINRLNASVKSDDARTWLQQFKKRRRLGPAGMIVVLITGIWMMAVRWGHQVWMMLAFLGIILIMLTGIILARRTLPRLTSIIDGKSGQLPENYYALAGTLSTSLRIRIAVGIAILALMTFKPIFPGL